MLTSRTRILHITPHLGGGVGRALSGLASFNDTSTEHKIICLETPQKSQFIDEIKNSGRVVIIKPDIQTLSKLVEQADIIQIEWWNHPATIYTLCQLSKIPIRLLIWSHISGIATPIVPTKLIKSAHKFIFTSQCSYESENIRQYLNKPESHSKIGIVASCGGFEHLPQPIISTSKNLSAGYVGSFNFTKLHPQYVEFLDKIDIPNFKVRMIGDLINKASLEGQCFKIGKPYLLEFCGYTPNIVAELQRLNIFPYLLNPKHYGTTENALLEAMALGIVPIVLSNPCENHIVKHGETGLIVQDFDAFQEAISWLLNNPRRRMEIAREAALQIRKTHSKDKMVHGLKKHYQDLMLTEKTAISFTDVFGEKPSDWFLSCQATPHIFDKSGDVYIESDFQQYSLFEQTKGSIFHFHSYFPKDLSLLKWKTHLEKFTDNRH